MNAVLHPLYYAVTWIIVEFHSLLGLIVGKHSHESFKWTLSIVLLVIVIRIIFIPLFVKSIKGQRAMTALQPHMKEIQKRYKDDRQKQSEELMKLYKEHKTSPWGSCLPMLAQSPIFFGLFRVLSGIAHDKSYVPNVLTQQLLATAHKAKFLGAPISDSLISSHITSTKIVTLFLILFMSATTFITQRQLMTKGMPKIDPSNNMMRQQQKIMLYLFPVIFAVTGVNFPIGVLIYWSTNNLWAFGQQFYVIKRNPTPGSPAYQELQRKRGTVEIANSSSGSISPEGMSEAEREEQAAKSRQRQQPKKKKPRK